MYLRWIKAAEAGMARNVYWLVKGMIEHLGEEEGKKLFLKQLNRMGNHNGSLIRQYYDSQGRENSLEEYRKNAFSDQSIFTFAWEGRLIADSKHDKIIEYTECPIAAGFKSCSSDGVEIGELYCNNIDNAIIQGYNLDYQCVRESSLNLDGLCRLHFKKKN
jgi:hypothetical protein